VKYLEPDREYLLNLLVELLEIPSPSGFTDSIVHRVGDELKNLAIDFELTRRGAIRANLPGKVSSPDRAVVAHLDTLGAMVAALKPNGRLAVFPVGTWSPRFAEGARVSIYTDDGIRRGTILPLLTSGHVYGDEIDRQPVAWSNLEVRIDERVCNEAALLDAGFAVGDFVSIDSQPEVSDNGFVVARHLDDKAGVAVLLAAAKAVCGAKAELPVDCHILFTISEEVGSGASAVLHQDVAEMVIVDNATPAPGKNSTEYDAHIAMMDASGPYDYHLSHKLIDLANSYEIPIRREVFSNYRSDAATAVEAGNDIRTALAAFGVDASHGWERTHVDGLLSLATLIGLYMQSEPTFERDKLELGPLAGFPDQTAQVELQSEDE
jgi:peptidase M42 family hydrolase